MVESIGDGFERVDVTAVRNERRVGENMHASRATRRERRNFGFRRAMVRGFNPDSVLCVCWIQKRSLSLMCSSTGS